MKTVKPLYVYVFWSESGDIEDKSLYTFINFEDKARRVAAAIPANSGYAKTKIKLITSDGLDHGHLRLDLATDDDTGVESRIMTMRRHKMNGTTDHDAMMVKYIDSIDWDWMPDDWESKS